MIVELVPPLAPAVVVLIVVVVVVDVEEEEVVVGIVSVALAVSGSHVCAVLCCAVSYSRSSSCLMTRAYWACRRWISSDAPFTIYKFYHGAWS